VKPAVVIGAGLTGLSAAHTLAGAGYAVTVYEREYVVGGHARSETFCDVPYEPHGAHIFHTTDREVWELVSALVEMLPYRHRVVTDLRGEFFSWPLQLDELHRLDEWGRIQDELAALPGDRDATNFETWCVSQMGVTLYELFIEGYTGKQWGLPGSKLSAALGPKRVELRRDGNRDLFRDPYQGWPARGYGALAEALAGDCEVVLGRPVTVHDLPYVAPRGAPVIVTAALDDFFDQRHGPLDWRGVSTAAHWLPEVVFSQPTMVVNRPSPDVPYTRTIETKHALGDSSTPGTMVMHEFPGAPAKHYPVLDADGANRLAHQRYEYDLATYDRNPLAAAGRLAHYTYINMDQAMREGFNVAERCSGQQ